MNDFKLKPIGGNPFFYSSEMNKSNVIINDMNGYTPLTHLNPKSEEYFNRVIKHDNGMANDMRKIERLTDYAKYSYQYQVGIPKTNILKQLQPERIVVENKYRNEIEQFRKGIENEMVLLDRELRTNPTDINQQIETVINNIETQLPRNLPQNIRDRIVERAVFNLLESQNVDIDLSALERARDGTTAGSLSGLPRSTRTNPATGGIFRDEIGALRFPTGTNDDFYTAITGGTIPSDGEDTELFASSELSAPVSLRKLRQRLGIPPQLETAAVPIVSATTEGDTREGSIMDELRGSAMASASASAVPTTEELVREYEELSRDELMKIVRDRDISMPTGKRQRHNIINALIEDITGTNPGFKAKQVKKKTRGPTRGRRR